MTLQERMNQMTTTQLEGMLESLKLTIDYSPMLSLEQLGDLTKSYQAILAEIRNRTRVFFVDSAREYSVGATVISQEGSAGLVVRINDYDSLTVKWETF